MAHDIDVHGNRPGASRTLARSLRQALLAGGAGERPVVFACIGTDRSTGDALGPLVGQWLVRSGYDRRHVMGTLEDPLHALNLRDRLADLSRHATPPLIVAVDAALGSKDSVGLISLRNRGLRPGDGVGKSLPSVGDVAITATVNVSAGAYDAHVLQSTRLFIVQSLARTIGVACWDAVRQISPPETSAADPSLAMA
jgi:putative sporulation protein YyaC